MKIAIAALIKNEIKNISSYLERNKDVDYICLLDTGSTDGTWEYLQEQSKLNQKLIIQQKVYEDFRFDIARNDSFKLIPDDIDIVVVLDIDEYFTDSNWVDIIRNNIKIDGNIHYYATFYIDGSNYSVTDYPRTLIAARIFQTKKFKWYYCVHEVISDADWGCLGYKFEENVDWNELIIIHQPDKNKNRHSYVPLCQKRVEEILPVQCDIEYEKDFSRDLLLVEYYRNNMYEEALKLYNEFLINSHDSVFDVSAYMYKMTNDKQYLRNAISMIKNHWYDDQILYYALKDDLEWCKQYKNDILEKINEHTLEFPDKFKKYDKLGNLVKEFAKKL